MKKPLSLFVALVATTALWASNVITYTATRKLTWSYLNVGAWTFGSAITSHDFSNGTGTITCAGEITTIGNNAFYRCSGLTSIDIPNSVTTIGDFAFSGCSGLKGVYITDLAAWCKISFSYYDANPLYYAHNLYLNNELLTDLAIPNGITEIKDDAFWRCSSLTSVTIPNSVTTIGENAFSGCSGLTSVTIGNSVTTIGEGAFYYCDGLTSVTIGNSVTTIGKNAFSGCTGLTSVTIPNSVTTIGNGAFDDCSGLQSVIFAEGSQLQTIGESAFYDCSSLTSIAIPNSVITIGGEAFSGCRGLTSVTIGNSVTTIGKYAFGRCSGLTSVTIPNSVTKIGSYAFEGCTGLTSITIPNSVTTIGQEAFSGCSSLPVEDNLRYADTYLIKAVYKTLATYTIKEGTKWIGDYAFYDCTGLTSVTIPNSVTTIGYYAFEGCTGLTSVTIPNSVTTIGNEAFYNCTGLISVTWNAKNCNGCNFGTQVETFVFGNEVEIIPSYFCSGMSKLTAITIPNSVTTIEYRAFVGCSGLISVTIGNSVTSIGDEAFDGCKNIRKITCFAKNPPICGTSVFSSLSQYTKAYVLASSLEDYQFANVWRDLNLYPIESEVVPLSGDQPIVTPTDQDVTITWPITDGTDTYTLTITKNGETVCVLTFNANGQLTNIAFAAPGHNGAHQAPAATLTAQGYQFTVIGLNPGTAYNYSVTATDAGGKTIAEHTGNFSTTGGTGLNTLPYDGKKGIGPKYFHNGNLIIERNGVKYTPSGQKVR